jgi:hypothetical protein
MNFRANNVILIENFEMTPIRLTQLTVIDNGPAIAEKHEYSSGEGSRRTRFL